MGDFEVKDEDLAGRIGILETRHGKLETPTFFPVINPLKTEISVKELKSMGFNNFITNSFILRKNNIIQGKIHEKFGEDMIIMTDSGAYQILEYGDIYQENRDIVSYEAEIKPDIAVFLDVPTGNADDWEEAKTTVRLTLERGKEISDIVKLNQDIIWVHPIQGGSFLDLVEYSAKEANKTEGFGMLALGSPTVLMEKYRYSTLIDSIYVAKSNVSRGVPFHLFGGGVPHIIPFAVALGVDTFDSASYIIFARDNRYLTGERTYRLEDLEYFPCSCPVCSKYSPKELLEMNKEGRTKLLAIHNLWKMKEEIGKVKQSIKEGRLFEYLQQKAYSHPALYSAFRSILKYSVYLEKYDPRVKGKVRGVLLFDSYSMQRPEIIRHLNYISSYRHKKEKAIIICGDKLTSPFSSDPKVKAIQNRNKGFELLVAIPFYGLVPVLSSESYPMSQFEMPEEVDNQTIEETLKVIEKIIKQRNYSEIRFMECEKSVLSHIMSINTSL
ncbi:tRNA guanosine(15) transglycosylase TgtA [Metallosphaera hakonensis]|uniref:tRNA-guanine(15) transglycosylase n=1 Tax=Metallosphaera hakonensis JCM 8857 = DSM 7519 TaxID=1293036 RepID=A0A2U9IX01_9CREN|nr:tRNA guanosine(15) transglycosylase TgtA [Metallosphaera hakonensis]AWS00609.1 tRNA guanosine(15) transglycosylase TgtA [Metallosphaera hakonensis JCM 8857 = DSM 7519]